MFKFIRESFKKVHLRSIFLLTSRIKVHLHFNKYHVMYFIQYEIFSVFKLRQDVKI